MNAFTSRFLLLFGWRRLAVAMGAGAASALALAPFHLFPVMFAVFPVLVLLIDAAMATARRPRRAAFLVGYAFGFGYFLAGLWWVGRAFLVDAEQFLWLMPPAMLALPAGLALFTGLGVWLAACLWRPNASRVVVLAVALTLVDILRGTVFTGFPWNAFGYTLAANAALMQGAALVGIYGLSLAAVLLFSAPVLLISRDRRDRRVGLGLIGAVALLWLGGEARLMLHPPHFVEGVKLRILQPNVDQAKKWRPEVKQEVVADYVALTLGSDGHGLTGITHVIWPETAFPFLLDREPWAQREIARMLPADALLLTGAIRAEAAGAGERVPRFYNSLLVLDGAGIIEAAYDKAHLLPFGEYLPLRSLLSRTGFERFLFPTGDFTAGPGPQTLDVPRLPGVSPVICYEAVFPGAVADRQNRPGVLVNITNDGWFGMTTGPAQHLHHSRLRAVEEGLPLVRSANTGISAVVDSYGRIMAELPLGARGTLDARLPVALQPTLFARSPYLGLILTLLCGSGTVWLLNRRLGRRSG